MKTRYRRPHYPRRGVAPDHVSGPIVGTLAGAAPPWSETSMASFAPSELDLRWFLTSATDRTLLDDEQ